MNNYIVCTRITAVQIPKLLKPTRKKIIAIGVLALIAIGILNQTNRNNQPELQTASAKRQDIKATVSSSGILTGKNTANLKFKSSGKLAYIKVKIGDKIIKNQPVAGLDTTDLSIALRQAQNTLRDKQAAAQKIEDDLKGHDTDETFAQKTTRTTAQVARDNAYEAVKQAQHDLASSAIFSPIEGVITQAIEVSGQNVSSSDIIVQVVDIKEVFLDTDIDEADISKISNGQKASVTLDAYPNKTFDAKVDQIIPQTKTTSSGATVIKVRVSVNLDGSTFINGLSGQASIVIKEATNVLTIPVEALREDYTVVLQTKQGLKPQKVTPGINSDTDIEIKDGLSEGDRVILDPPVNLNDRTGRRTPIGAGIRLFGGRDR